MCSIHWETHCVQILGLCRQITRVQWSVSHVIIPWAATSQIGRSCDLLKLRSVVISSEALSTGMSSDPDLGALRRICMVKFGNEAIVQSDLLRFILTRASHRTYYGYGRTIYGVYGPTLKRWWYGTGLQYGKTAVFMGKLPLTQSFSSTAVNLCTGLL